MCVCGFGEASHSVGISVCVYALVQGVSQFWEYRRYGELYYAFAMIHSFMREPFTQHTQGRIVCSSIHPSIRVWCLCLCVLMC